MRDRTRLAVAMFLAVVGMATRAAEATTAGGSWRPARETGVPAADGLGYVAQAALLRSSGEGSDVNEAVAGLMMLASAEPPAMTPAPTSPFDRRGRLLRRIESTNCGYVSGIGSSSIYCDTADECVFNTKSLIAGCCPTTSTDCPVFTSCLPQTDSAQYNSTMTQMLYCSDDSSPECVTYEYKTGLLSGYSLYSCAATAGTQVIALSSTDSSTSATSSTSSTSSTASSTSASSSSGTKSTHAGAIAGGVVGGVAGVSLLALAAFFVIRRRRQSKTSMTDSGGAGAAGGDAAGRFSPYGGSNGAPPQSPQPQQQYYAAPLQEQPVHEYVAPAAVGVAAAGAVGAVAAANTADAGNAGNAAGTAAHENEPYDAPVSQTPPGVISPLGVQSPDMPMSAMSMPPLHATAPGMGYHSGPIPATYEMAELPPDSEVRELP